MKIGYNKPVPIGYNIIAAHSAPRTLNGEHIHVIFPQYPDPVSGYPELEQRRLRSEACKNGLRLSSWSLYLVYGCTK